MYPKLFGGLIACILLATYVYLVTEAIGTVDCTPQPGCLGLFTDRMAAAMALIGGLVSALVISELAITKAGEVPLVRSLASDVRAPLLGIVKFLTLAYLLVWLATGFAAFWIGLRRTELQSLVDLGQSWLGLAVASGYAYFGLRPPARKQEG